MTGLGLLITTMTEIVKISENAPPATETKMMPVSCVSGGRNLKELKTYFNSKILNISV